jgi:coenzyme F420-reducing hydrogenase gamma subunit
VPCLGPITHAGCGAICPAYRRGCYGCYGPSESPNIASLMAQWEAAGVSRAEMVRVLRAFNAAAEPFARASEAYENDKG